MSELKKPKRLKSFQTASHHRSAIQERELAKYVHGKRVRGSGSGIEKGDVRLKRVLRIEAKTTKADSFRVTREMVKRIEETAAGAGELPVVVVEFNDGNGKAQGRVCVVPFWVLDVIRSAR